MRLFKGNNTLQLQLEGIILQADAVLTKRKARVAATRPSVAELVGITTINWSRSGRSALCPPIWLYKACIGRIAVEVCLAE